MKASIDLQTTVVLCVAVAHVAAAVSCPTLKASYATPNLADGWEATLIAQNLTGPRSIIFDSNGALLLVDRGTGVVHIALEDGGGGCIDTSSRTVLVESTDLNHGIALSNDGKTLYASTSDQVLAWTYDAAGPSVGSSNRTLVTGMSNDDHTTRTLLMSDKEPGMLIVSRGSDANIDIEAEDFASGHAQLKAFNMTNVTSTSDPYDFTTEGRLLGWGLRNSVGIAEEPLTGGIYSVENSADNIARNDVDIHQNNPGEEMNFHGYLNASTEDQGGNYGYPYCFSLWNTSIPDLGNLTVGSQFTLDQNATINDDFCASERVPPRLTFQAHMAPLDIIFLPDGSEAFVAFHGSWDRTEPAGYKVVSINFANGSPVDSSDSLTATTTIFSNADNSKCPGACFRPVSLALDSQGRMFMTSDGTGEIYALIRSSTGTSTSTTSAPSTSPTSTAPAAASSTKPSLGNIGKSASVLLWILALLSAVALM